MTAAQPADTARADYANGLHAYADAYAADPDMPRLGFNPAMLLTHSAAEFVAVAALVEDPHPTLGDVALRFAFELHGHIRGLPVTVYAEPGDACEKTVTRMVAQSDWAYRGVPVQVSS